MIVTLTGPSGSGKTSLLFRLIKLWPDQIQPLVSSTSRPPRSKEKEGENYYFVDREAFSSEDMVEQVSFCGNLYGLTRQELAKAKDDDKISIAVVNVAGSLWLKEHYGAIRIFMRIAPGTSRYRLVRRDGEEEALKRHKADKEAGLYDSKGYDIIIQNNRKTLTQITMQFVEKMKPYTESNDALQLNPPEGRHIFIKDKKKKESIPKDIPRKEKEEAAP